MGDINLRDDGEINVQVGDGTETLNLTLNDDKDINLTILEKNINLNLDDSGDIALQLLTEGDLNVSLIESGDINISLDGVGEITSWGSITGTLSNQTDLQAELDLKTDETDFISHTGDLTIHYAQNTIDHTIIQNIGTNTHAQIDSHIADTSIHFSDLSGFDTDDLSEGSSNLYDQTVVLTSGTGISITGTYPSFTINSTITQYTDEMAQDSIGTILSDEFTYNDSIPSISLDYSNISHTSLQDIGSNTHPQIDSHISDSTIHFTESSIDHGNLTGLSDDDHTQYYNSTRIESWLSTKSTDDLNEGTNLYFTDERARDSVGGMVQSTDTIIMTYIDSSDILKSDLKYQDSDTIDLSEDSSGLKADVKYDSINNLHIDWGTGTNQVYASNIPILDTGGYYSGSEVETALQEIGSYMESENLWDRSGTTLVTHNANDNLSVDGFIQATGFASPSSGKGVELRYLNSRANVLGYDRDTTSYIPLELKGSSIYFNIAGSDLGVLNSSGRLSLSTTGSSAGLLIGGDTQLYRYSSNIMRTPDNFYVDGRINVGSNGEAYVQGIVDMHGTGFPIARYCNKISGNDSGSFTGFGGINSTNYLTKETTGVIGNGFGHGLVFGSKDSTMSGDAQYITRIYSRVDDDNGALTTRAGRLQFWIGSNGQKRSLDLCSSGLGRFEESVQVVGYVQPHEGIGAELRYYSGRAGLLGYNRDTTSYLPVEVKGETVYLNASGNDIVEVNSNAIKINGGEISNLTTVNSTPYNVLATDRHLSIDTSSIAITLNLPAISSTNHGQRYTFKDGYSNASSNNVTITPNGTDQIDNGGAGVSINLIADDEVFDLIANNTTGNWEIAP